MRSIRGLLVLAMCPTLLAACGGSAGGSVGRARAEAFARLVNLASGDVPGMVSIASASENAVGPPFGSCTGYVTAAEKVVAANSPRFVRAREQRYEHGVASAQLPPVEGVHSGVYVMRRPEVARRNVATARKAGTASCVQRVSVTEAAGRFIGREPYKREIKATLLPFPLSGVAGYGLRVSGTLAATLFHQKTRPAYYEDSFGFAVGPAEIVLHVVGVVRPFPSAVERSLLSLLYARAKAHAL